MKPGMKSSKMTLHIGALLVFLVLNAGQPSGLAADLPNDGFKSYTQKMPGSSVSFDMVAIPGGEITVGSPANEAGRDKSDLPQKKVTVKSFWMGKYEVSWAEFLPFVFVDMSEIVRNTNKLEGRVDKDGISHPTAPYGSVYRERGEKGYPALGFGYPTACQYCLWLSKKTGVKYRLATEEEWEYACRAGSTTPNFWGNDAAQAKEYGWFKDNSVDDTGRETTQPIGKLKPNKFGLYDIVGNIGEWCQKSSTNQPGVIRGGTFESGVTGLRSASRMIETEEWNEMDPQSPQSIWWLASADFVGLRIVRSADDTAELPKPESKKEVPVSPIVTSPSTDKAK